MKKLLIETAKLIVAIIVFLPLAIIGIIYTFFKHILKLDYYFSKQLNPLIKSLALLLDGLANAGGGELLNDILKIKGNIKYGEWDRTISAVTGLLLKFKGIDNKFRIRLDKIMGTNHSIEAITKEDNFYYTNNEK